MKKLLVLLFLAVPVFAVPPDVVELAQKIERFPAQKEGSDSARLKAFFDLYWTTTMHAAPDYAVDIGYEGVEERLPDFSKETFAFQRRLVHLELAALLSIDRAHLTAAEQLNYDLLQRRFEMSIESDRFAAIDDVLLVDSMNDAVLGALGTIGYMPARKAADYEKMLALLRGFPRFVDQSMVLLDEGLKRGITPPRVTLSHVVERTVADITDDPLKSAFLTPFANMPESIPASERERLRSEAAKRFREQVVPALRKWHDYLATTYVPHARQSIALSDLPDGRALYAYLLRYYTTTNLTPEEMHQLGLSEVKRIRGEMEKVIAETGFKGTFQEFLTYLRTDPRFFYTTAEELVAGYRDVAKRIDPELPKLFGRLPRLPYGVKPMEGDSKTLPSALYSNGTLSTGRPGWMLVNTYDLKARPKWGMASLTAHEAVPGHHLQ